MFSGAKGHEVPGFLEFHRDPSQKRESFPQNFVVQSHYFHSTCTHLPEDVPSIGALGYLK